MSWEKSPGLGFGGFLKLRGTIWGPDNEDYSILGSILGSHYFWKLPFRV